MGPPCANGLIVLTGDAVIIFFPSGLSLDGIVIQSLSVIDPITWLLSKPHARTEMRFPPCTNA